VGTERLGHPVDSASNHFLGSGRFPRKISLNADPFSFDDQWSDGQVSSLSEVNHSLGLAEQQKSDLVEYMESL
jgi:hypothetical protein